MDNKYCDICVGTPAFRRPDVPSHADFEFCDECYKEAMRIGTPKAPNLLKTRGVWGLVLAARRRERRLKKGQYK